MPGETASRATRRRVMFSPMVAIMVGQLVGDVRPVLG